MNRIYDFDKYKKALEVRKQREKEVRSSGRHILRHLKELKEQRRKLSQEDRITLAYAIGKELAKLKKKPGFNLGAFAIGAGLTDEASSRELHKLSLSPNSSEARQRDLRAYPDGYFQLIDAIHKEIGGSEFELLDRLTAGTSLHPSQLKDSEMLKVYFALEKSISNINEQFKEFSGGLTLLETFQETAQMKVKLRRDHKSIMRWPYYDAEVAYDDENPADYESEYVSPTGFTPPKLEDEIDSQYAYWRRDCNFLTQLHRQEKGYYCYPSDLSHYEAIMNLPRIYLGVVKHWETDGPFEFQEDIEKEREFSRDAIGELTERRSSDGQAKLVVRNDNTPKHTSVYEGGCHETDHCWLIIYPTPDNESLCPVIYRPYTEGGTHLWPLNPTTMEILKSFEFINKKDTTTTLYDRIKQLMGYGNGEFEIYREWEKTSRDLLINPVRREYMRIQNLEKSFDAHLNKLLSANHEICTNKPRRH